MISKLGLIDVYTLLYGVGWTALLSIAAFIGSALLGLVLLGMTLSPLRTMRALSRGYIYLIQGVPVLGNILLVFFGIALLGYNISPFVAAAISLSIYGSAFFCDIWSGAVNAIPKGQWEASLSIGLKPARRFQLVILPQALLIAIPPTVGFLVQLIKHTSIASITGVVELSRAGQIISSATYQVFIVYGVVCALYFAICYPLTSFSRYLERRLSTRRAVA